VIALSATLHQENSALSAISTADGKVEVAAPTTRGCSLVFTPKAREWSRALCAELCRGGVVEAALCAACLKRHSAFVAEFEALRIFGAATRAAHIPSVARYWVGSSSAALNSLIIRGIQGISRFSGPVEAIEATKPRILPMPFQRIP